MMDNRLEQLRASIEQLDAQLIAIAAERIAVARRIGDVKRDHQLPTVDVGREGYVLAKARERAAEQGLAPDVAEEIVTRLIMAAVAAQDEDAQLAGGR